MKLFHRKSYGEMSSCGKHKESKTRRGIQILQEAPRVSRTPTISFPTAPVAPQIPTLRGVFAGRAAILRADEKVEAWRIEGTKRDWERPLYEFTTWRRTGSLAEEERGVKEAEEVR
mmetsp:Transcript_24802/g.81546  ORF Transcript_24802/g.81546 Transcript_24802/m.81546 type:complete len:116 (-) Transcript_24802:120-467(-)